MSKPVVLVTQTTVAKEAQELLRDAGFEIVFMGAPISEAALLAQLTGCYCGGMPASWAAFL